MLVSFPMYDFEEVSQATAEFWSALRDEILVRAPDLDLPECYISAANIADLFGHWLDPALFLSQTCGYPLTHSLKGQVRYVATPVYSVPGCTDDGDYCSFILARRDSGITNLEAARKAAFAYNERGSQSGYNAMSWMTHGLADCDPDAFFGATKESGGHRNSMRMVAQGEADICAVDCVTYALIKHHAPQEIEDLIVLDETPKAPALPFITSLTTSDEYLAIIQDALRFVFERPEVTRIKQMIFLKNINIRPLSSYNLICDVKVAKTTV